MKLSAFFYDNQYYLFPESYGTVEALANAVADGLGEITLTRLNDTKCMAPYFSNKAPEKVLLTIDHEKFIFPCEVELMTQAEYDNRLRKVVTAFCPGCPNFSDAEDLTGHHEEISLDSVCFIRDHSNGAYPVNVWIDRFVDVFDPVEYGQLIDSEQYEEAAARWEEELSETAIDIVPPVYFTKEDGKYALYTTTYLEHEDRLLMEYLMKQLNEAYNETWVFSHYLPRGFFAAEACEPASVLLEPVEGTPTPVFDITLYATEPESAAPYYLWLCGALGEDIFHAVCNGLHILPDDDVDENALSPDEAANVILHLTEDMPEQQLVMPSPSMLCTLKEDFDYDEERDGPLDEDTFNQEMVIHSIRSKRLYDTFLRPIHEGDIPTASPWGEPCNMTFLKLPILRLLFDTPAESMDQTNEPFMADYMKRLQNLFDILKDQHLTSLFYQRHEAGYMEVAGLVYHLPGLLYTLRRCAPIFACCPGEAYIYTMDGEAGGRFALGKTVIRLSTESELRNDMGWKDTPFDPDAEDDTDE